MNIGRFGKEAWRDIGGESALLDRVGPPPEVELPSRLAVTSLAHDSVAMAILAVNEVSRARGMSAETPEVRVDGARLVTSFQSERHIRVNGEAPAAWAPLSGFWETSDGWVRTHGNYPHHADRLRRLLGLPAGATADQLRVAFRARSAADLEDAAAAADAVVARVRTPEEWASHSHAAAIRATPLVGSSQRAGAAPRTWDAQPTRPLDGIRVLDLTRVIAGPVATRDLAFAGASVLRVDAPQLPEIAWQHLDTGQGKRSTRLNLASRSDRAVFDGLLSAADVLVMGYRPGALAPFGLDAETCLERYPGLVVASVTAWGETGPWAGRRGFDSIVQAASGIAMTESADGRTPGALPAQALDHSAGHFLAAGITLALLDQRVRGGATVVSAALARIAQALLEAPPTQNTATHTPEPALQSITIGGRQLTTALPVLTYAGAPRTYPDMSRAWGEDPATW